MIAAVEQHRPGPGARTAARLGGHVPALDTARLQLRAPRIYDFASYFEILGSGRARFMGGPCSRQEAWSSFAEYTAQWLLHGHGLWTIDAQTKPSAGFVSLGFEYADPEPELGIFVTEEIEGCGMALEALNAACAHAFGALGWPSVVSFVDPDNARCIRLMDRAGARRDPALERTLTDGALAFRHHARAEAA